MKSRNVWMALVVGAGVVLGTSAGFGQTKDEKKPADPKAVPAAKPADKPAGEKPAAPAAKPVGDKAASGAPSADDMKKMMEMSLPGKEHDALKPLQGNWSTVTKFWMEPGGQPQESAGVIARKWIHDNRYLTEDVTGNAGGMPFAGFGIMGYDKNGKTYQSVWTDNMGTEISFWTGSFDASGKTLTMKGDMFCPMEGKKKPSKMTMEIVNNDKNILRMFDTGPDGKEWMNFEMVSTRK